MLIDYAFCLRALPKRAQAWSEKRRSFNKALQFFIASVCHSIPASVMFSISGYFYSRMVYVRSVCCKYSSTLNAYVADECVYNLNFVHITSSIDTSIQAHSVCIFCITTKSPERRSINREVIQPHFNFYLTFCFKSYHNEYRNILNMKQWKDFLELEKNFLRKHRVNEQSE